jgi:quinol monooxygenase YgiN
MVAKTAEFTVKKGKLKIMKEAIDQFVRTVHVSEPGTRMYISLQDEENEFKFLHIMIFESDGAEKKHQAAVYTEKFNEILQPNCKSRPVIKNYTFLGGL